MVRFFLAFSAIALIAVSLTGCVGPINNRLYPAEWKAKRAHPVPVYTKWTYQGEHWEHIQLVDEEGNRP